MCPDDKRKKKMKKNYKSTTRKNQLMTLINSEKNFD